MAAQEFTYRDLAILRQEIRDAFYFIEADLEIDERLLQTLEYTDDAKGEFPASSLVLLQSAVSCQPSIAAAIEASGVAIDHLSLSPIHRLNPSHLGDISDSFNMWFEDTRNLFSRIRKTKCFSLVDAISTCLESRSDVIDPRFEANDLVHFFAHQIGAVRRFPGDRGIYNILRLDSFCQRLARKLRHIVDREDVSAGSQQFIMYHDGRGYRLQPFGMWGTYQLQEAPLRDGSLWIARTNVIQPVSRFTEASLAELEKLINRDGRERDFQTFFELNPEYLLALGDYIRIHPQLVLHEEGGSRLIPDFFLEKINSDFGDICDLKAPTAKLVRFQRNRTRFRDAVREAIAQLETYQDYFESERNRREFQARYGLRAYRPRVVVIVGRRSSYSADVNRIKLESRLPAWVTLRTYDDVVSKARQWRQIVVPD